MNLKLDSNGILKIKSKFADTYMDYHPIILPKKSHLTMYTIQQMHHHTCGHGGAYQEYKEHGGSEGNKNKNNKQIYNKNFAKRISCYKLLYLVSWNLMKCIVCRRYNSRPIKFNENSYRSNQVKPSTIISSDIFMDY